MYLRNCIFLRAIRAASQGGLEVGFHANDATKLVAQTAKGTADLLLQWTIYPEHEIDKVTSLTGRFIDGSNEMEPFGFSSETSKEIK